MKVGRTWPNAYFLSSSSERHKILDPYEEDFVKKQLGDFPDTSAAQMHDWLKEHYSNFSGVTPRIVHNFVTYIRQKHNIPYIVPTQDFFPVEDLPYGRQSQADFGEYNMRMTSGKRKKERPPRPEILLLVMPVFVILVPIKDCLVHPNDEILFFSFNIFKSHIIN